MEMQRIPDYLPNVYAGLHDSIFFAADVWIHTWIFRPKYRVRVFHGALYLLLCERIVCCHLCLHSQTSDMNQYSSMQKIFPIACLSRALNCLWQPHLGTNPVIASTQVGLPQAI